MMKQLALLISLAVSLTWAAGCGINVVAGRGADCDAAALERAERWTGQWAAVHYAGGRATQGEVTRADAEWIVIRGKNQSEHWIKLSLVERIVTEAAEPVHK